MHITKLRLYNYRNFCDVSADFSSGVNIIYGDNAQGKTNLLEAVFFASTGRSHRTKSEKELIRFGEKNASVGISFTKELGSVLSKDKIEFVLKNGESKSIMINGRSIKRLGELFGELQTVIFSPEDLSVVNNNPSERRRFMDIQICQINKIYYYHLHTYYKILKQRNKLLKNSEIRNIEETIFAWDGQLIEHGIEIIEIRKRFIEAVSEKASEIHGIITDGKEQIEIAYKPDSGITDVSDYTKKLKKNVRNDILYKTTGIGPHKDDVIFKVNGKDVKTFGSQGQKRTVILSCRLAEIGIIKDETGEAPVLLLDDAFSELDKSRQIKLLKYIENIQAFITATGTEDLIENAKNGARLFYIKEGKIQTETEGTNE